MLSERLPKAGRAVLWLPDQDWLSISLGLPEQDIKHWLSWLRSDVGFDGWRFDFVKGYGGRHVREYVEATQPDLAVGEFWDDCAYTDSLLHQDQVRGLGFSRT